MLQAQVTALMLSEESTLGRKCEEKRGD